MPPSTRRYVILIGMSSNEQNAQTTAPVNTDAPQTPEKKTVPPEFFRQPYSFVRRGDRLTSRRQKAWDTYSQTTCSTYPGCGQIPL